MTADETDRIEALRTEVVGVKEEIAHLSGLIEGGEKSRAEICADHTRRIARLEMSAGRANLISTVLGVVGGAIALAVRAAFGKGG